MVIFTLFRKTEDANFTIDILLKSYAQLMRWGGELVKRNCIFVVGKAKVLFDEFYLIDKMND